MQRATCGKTIMKKPTRRHVAQGKRRRNGSLKPPPNISPLLTLNAAKAAPKKASGLNVSDAIESAPKSAPADMIVYSVTEKAVRPAASTASKTKQTKTAVDDGKARWQELKQHPKMLKTTAIAIDQEIKDLAIEVSRLMDVKEKRHTLLTNVQSAIDELSGHQWKPQQWNAKKIKKIGRVVANVQEYKKSKDLLRDPELLKMPASFTSVSPFQKMIYIDEFIVWKAKESIGEGGSGAVYRACGQDGEIYALKVIKLPLGNNPKMTELRARRISQFKNETEVLKLLEDQPRIIRVKGSGANELKGHLMILMEYGRIDLHQKLLQYQNDSVPVSHISMMLRAMFLAVRDAHGKHVVHGDIKPKNFVYVHDTLKLIDFGSATSLGSDVARTVEDYMGTELYMAPETWGSPSQLSLASDIWSLGVIAYYMAYRKMPITPRQGQKYWVILVCNEFSIEFPPHPDDDLLNLIKRCLQKDPIKRPTIHRLLEHPFVTRMISPQAFD